METVDDQKSEPGFSMGTQYLKAIPRRAQPGPVPLSAAQAQLWTLQHLDRRNPAWNRPLVIRLTGRLDIRGLEWSLTEIVRRHEILRTVFPEIGGEPVQIVRPVEPLHLEIRSLEYLLGSERRKAIAQVAAEETRTIFDLARGSLVRTVLLRLDEEEHVLVLLMHHIVFDEWSEGILLRELTAFYEMFGGGKASSPLPELPIQYADFSIWEHKRLTDAALKTQLDYWRQRLHGLSPLRLPTDYPRTSTFTHQGASQSFMLPLSLVGELKDLSRQEQVTLFMTLLTALQVVLSRYTGQEDIAVGVPIAGRTQLETESLIGYFINLLVLRVALPRNINFREALSRVRDSALDAYANQEVPFQTLVKELRPRGSANFSPLFRVMFELRNVPKAPIQQFKQLRMEIVPFSPDVIGALDLVVEVLEKENGLCCTCRYAAELFRPGTIKRMTENFRTVLQRIIDNPHQRLSDLPLDTEADRQQRKLDWQDAKRELFDDTCSSQRFEAPVERIAEAAAEVTKVKTDLEEKIAQIWRDVLGLDEVGVSDNFFELGGHSLLMVQIHNKIGDLLGKEYPVIDLCSYPTIGSLADYLTRQHHG
jgi:aspartate racemase